MKILVTGGAGFIGSHIVDRYIELGHEVVVVDNLSTGNESFVNPKAKFYREDICSSNIASIFKSESPDIVNHHAAQIDVRKSVTDPVGDAKINIIGSLNVLQNAINIGVKKFIFASTGGAIYGVPESLPVLETHLKRSVCPYGVAKATIEGYLFAMEDYTAIDYTVLRYGNVYGPRQNHMGEAGVCAIFIGKLLQNEQCILYGNGTPVRDYVFVDDVVGANVISLDKGSKEIYNIGTGIGTTVGEIYQILRELMKKNIDPKEEPLRKGELQEIYLDRTKAQKELNWTPQTTLKDGLQKTLDYFVNN